MLRIHHVPRDPRLSGHLALRGARSPVRNRPCRLLPALPRERRVAGDESGRQGAGDDCRRHDPCSSPERWCSTCSTVMAAADSSPRAARASTRCTCNGGWFAEATFTRPLGEIVNHRREFGDRAIPEVIKEMEARARMCLDAVDREMHGKDYLTGDFTAADIMMGYALRSCQRLLPDDPLPADAGAYWERLTARDAYRAAIAAESA